MPGVTHAEVRPIPDPFKENDILLRVAGSVTEADVKAWCEQRLSAYKQPSEIEIAALNSESVRTVPSTKYYAHPATASPPTARAARA